MLFQLKLIYIGYVLVFMTSVSVLISIFAANQTFAKVTASFTAAFSGYVSTVLLALPRDIPEQLSSNAIMVACLAGLLTFGALHPWKPRKAPSA